MRRKPNIKTTFNDKSRFKSLVQETINDAWIYTHVPDMISLSDDNFTITLSNKKLVFEDIKVDSSSDYIDIYLQGIKTSANTYLVIDNGTNIVITFTESITYSPEDVANTDFLVKGKIISR